MNEYEQKRKLIKAVQLCKKNDYINFTNVLANGKKKHLQ